MQKTIHRLDKVRTPQNDISVKKKVLYSVLVLALGIVLGTVSKALDETAVNELPAFLEYLDIGNFLGRFSIWIFIAVYTSNISVTKVWSNFRQMSPDISGFVPYNKSGDKLPDNWRSFDSKSVA